MLAEERIVIWNMPVEKDEALKVLTQKACEAAKIGDWKKIYDTILKREEQGSTFFNGRGLL